jgi:hypothetical protein
LSARVRLFTSSRSGSCPIHSLQFRKGSGSEQKRPNPQHWLPSRKSTPASIKEYLDHFNVLNSSFLDLKIYFASKITLTLGLKGTHCTYITKNSVITNSNTSFWQAQIKFFKLKKLPPQKRLINLIENNTFLF